MKSAEIADRVVREHTELQEFLLQWEAALLQFDAADFTEWQRSVEQLWGLVPFLDKELPRHFRAEEEHLFPSVEARHPESLPALTGFIGEQWRQYKQDLLYCDAVLSAQPARERGLGLVEGLRRHIREEEVALLPLLEAA
jgi:hemerythrin-like domain-containing protein